MTKYDDLQLFKQKAQITDFEYQNLFAQSSPAGSHQWTIIKQLSQGNDALTTSGQQADLVPPLPTSPAAFARPAAVRQSQEPMASVTPSPAAAAPQSAVPQQNPTPAGNPLMASVASMMPSPAAAAPQFAVPQQNPTPAGNPLMASVASMMPASQSAAPAARYKNLFSAPRGDQPVGKDTPLKSLLEMIAVCR